MASTEGSILAENLENHSRQLAHLGKQVRLLTKTVSELHRCHRSSGRNEKDGTYRYEHRRTHNHQRASREEVLTADSVHEATTDERECYAEAILRLLPKLVDLIPACKTEFTDYLVGGCLSESECEQARKMSDRKTQVRFILELIKERDLSIIQNFLAVLGIMKTGLDEEIEDEFHRIQDEGGVIFKCTYCKILLNVDIKSVIDYVYSRHVIPKTFYRHVYLSNNQSSDQRILWDELAFICANFEPPELALKCVIEGLRAKNRFIYLADELSQKLEQNKVLKCRCKEMVRERVDMAVGPIAESQDSSDVPTSVYSEEDKPNPVSQGRRSQKKTRKSCHPPNLSKLKKHDDSTSSSSSDKDFNRRHPQDSARRNMSSGYSNRQSSLKQFRNNDSTKGENNRSAIDEQETKVCIKNTWNDDSTTSSNRMKPMQRECQCEFEIDPKRNENSCSVLEGELEQGCRPIPLQSGATSGKKTDYNGNESLNPSNETNPIINKYGILTNNNLANSSYQLRDNRNSISLQHHSMNQANFPKLDVTEETCLIEVNEETTIESKNVSPHVDKADRILTDTTCKEICSSYQDTLCTSIKGRIEPIGQATFCTLPKQREDSQYHRPNSDQIPKKLGNLTSTDVEETGSHQSQTVVKELYQSHEPLSEAQLCSNAQLHSNIPCMSLSEDEYYTSRDPKTESIRNIPLGVGSMEFRPQGNQLERWWTWQPQGNNERNDSIQNTCYSNRKERLKMKRDFDTLQLCDDSFPNSTVGLTDVQERMTPIGQSSSSLAVNINNMDNTTADGFDSCFSVVPPKKTKRSRWKRFKSLFSSCVSRNSARICLREERSLLNRPAVEETEEQLIPFGTNKEINAVSLSWSVCDDSDCLKVDELSLSPSSETCQQVDFCESEGVSDTNADKEGITVSCLFQNRSVRPFTRPVACIAPFRRAVPDYDTVRLISRRSNSFQSFPVYTGTSIVRFISRRSNSLQSFPLYTATSISPRSYCSSWFSTI